jgi:hypothetical protein
MQARGILAVLLILILTTSTFALSADEAISLVSVTNNYLMTGETPNVVKQLISYQKEDYMIVVAMKGTSPTCYIPIKNSNSSFASLDLEIRELIKTTIVLTNMTDVKNSTSTANWLFSYSTKNFFYDLSNDFTQMTGSLATVQSELEKVNTTESKKLAGQAEDTKTLISNLATKSKSIATEVEQGRIYEESFLSDPDTNEVTKYETNYSNLFTHISEYKTDYIEIEKNLNELNQGIGALQAQNFTVDQKSSLQSILSTPVNARRLSSFFNQTDQIRTLIENVFNLSKGATNYATTLEGRKTRNEAWLVIYGTNQELMKVDPTFDTLKSAATTVLSKDYVDLWKDQSAVEALKTNWAGAENRYNNAEYTKAKDFAKKAESNIKQIMNEGPVEIEEDNGQQLIINIVIGLVILVVVLFVYEKYIAKKKKVEDEYVEP